MALTRPYVGTEKSNAKTMAMMPEVIMRVRAMGVRAPFFTQIARRIMTNAENAGMTAAVVLLASAGALRKAYAPHPNKRTASTASASAAAVALTAA